MKITNILALCMVVCIISFMGFAVENIWLAVTKGYMDNRNMVFPFLLGYGIAVLFIYFILGTPGNLWFFGHPIRVGKKLTRLVLYFAGCMVFVSIGEILLGKTVEKTCHFYWWDYSQLPMHLTRYTSAPTSVGFSCLITFFMDKIFLPLYYCIEKWNSVFLRVVAAPLMALLVFDLFYNGYLMYREKGMVVRWRMDTTGSWVYRKFHVFFEDKDADGDSTVEVVRK